MNTNKSRVIITVMPPSDGGVPWTIRYNPGRGEPNMQAEGQSKTKQEAFSAAFAEARKFTGMEE